MTGPATFSSWTMTIPPGFHLSKAVCSYGWTILAPNFWDRTAKMDVSKPEYEGAFRRMFSTLDGDKIKISRMLRLNGRDMQAVTAFQESHEEARKVNFGRLLRSPTVWEDLVKCILLCNCGWGRTVSMNAALCEKFGQGAFPSPAQIAKIEPSQLQSDCGVGYRAKSIVKLATQIDSGEINPEDLEDSELSDEEVYKKLQSMPGIGPFSAANMLQLLGRYERIACDSETVRHLKTYHDASKCTSSNCEQVAAEIYSKYAPYQFIAYWFELWHEYEALLGPIAKLDPELYKSFTGHNMRNGMPGSSSRPGSSQKLRDKRPKSKQKSSSKETTGDLDVEKKRKSPRTSKKRRTEY